MRHYLMFALFEFITFASGVVIAGGVFAFIATIGVVPRFAKKTKTQNYLRLYENAIIAGGVFGASTMAIDYYIPLGRPLVMVFSCGIGIFVGCMAVSLAEVLDVVPILTRRGKVAIGLPLFMFFVAIGKLVGSLIYYKIPGFYDF